MSWPGELPCHGEEMHLTQKYTEGLFLEVSCLNIPPRLGAARVELALWLKGKYWKKMEITILVGILPWLCLEQLFF